MINTPTTLDPREMTDDLRHTGELSMLYRCAIAVAFIAALDRAEKAEASAIRWKANCQANAAALHIVEEAFGHLLPGSITAGAHLPGPDPVHQANAIIGAMHKVRAALDHIKSHPNFKA